MMGSVIKLGHYRNTSLNYCILKNGQKRPGMPSVKEQSSMQKQKATRRVEMVKSVLQIFYECNCYWWRKILQHICILGYFYLLNFPQLLTEYYKFTDISISIKTIHNSLTIFQLLKFMCLRIFVNFHVGACEGPKGESDSLRWGYMWLWAS